MLHTKCIGSRSSGFRQEYFSCFSYINLCKTCDTQGGTIFGPKGHNLNKLDRDLLGDATYQISRLFGLWFQAGRFLIFFLYQPMLNNRHVTPGMVLKKAPGAKFEQTW